MWHKFYLEWKTLISLDDVLKSENFYNPKFELEKYLQLYLKLRKQETQVKI